MDIGRQKPDSNVIPVNRKAASSDEDAAFLFAKGRFTLGHEEPREFNLSKKKPTS
jgi:hypothetical protein